MKIQRRKESALASICLPKEGKAKCLLGKDKQETSSSSAKTIKIKLKVKAFCVPTFQIFQIKGLNNTARLKMSGMQRTLSTTWTISGSVGVRSRSSLPRETERLRTRCRPRSAILLAVPPAMTMIGIAAEDGPGAAAMSAAGHGAPHMSAVHGGLKAQEDLVPTVDTDGAEAMKMKSTEVLLLASTTGHNVNQAHVATLHRAPLHPPDPCPKVKRASPDLTPQVKTTTQLPVPRKGLWDDLHPAPNLDPCPAHVLAPGPGLAASLEATEYLHPTGPVKSVSQDVCVQL